MLPGTSTHAVTGPGKQPRRGGAFGAKGVRAGVALLATLPLAFALGRAYGAAPGPLGDFADPFRSDLALALSVDSEAATSRRAQVARAEAGLRRARRGLELTFEVEPEAELELDLLSGGSRWGTDLDVKFGAQVARDLDLVLRAEAALATAQGRLRAQLRDDQRVALLALSDLRTGSLDLAEAEADAEETAAALAAARADASDPEELRRLELNASLADLELRRERIAHEERLSRVDRLGPGSADVCAPALLTGPLAAEVVRPAEHAQAAALRIALARAELAWRELPFETVQEIELTGAYENGGAELSAALGLDGGVPSLEAELGWSTGTPADPNLVLGVSATLAFSADSRSRTNLVGEELDAARRELAAFGPAQSARESTARALLELAYEELTLFANAADAAAADVAGAQSPGERERLERAAERARAEAEDAWRGYVRTLFEYLDEIDAVLAAPTCDASGALQTWMRWS